MNLGVMNLSIALAFLLVAGFVFGAKFSIYPFILFLLFYFLIAYPLAFSQFKIEEPAYIGSLVYCFTIICTFFVIRAVKENTLLKALRYVIIFHCGAVVLQFFTFLLFGKYIDLHNYITFFSYESRPESNSLSGWGLIRPTGFLVEPSNVAALITFFNVIYLSIVRKFDSFFVKVQLCTFLTLSFAAIGISSLILMVVLFNYSINQVDKFKKTIAVATIILILVISIFVFYWRVYIAVDYDSLAYRMVILRFFQSISLESLLFGHGILISKYPLLVEGVYLNNSHFRDVGFFVNSIFSFGTILTFIFILFSFFCNKWFVFFTLIIALFSKFDYMQPIFWFALMFYFFWRYDRRYECR